MTARPKTGTDRPRRGSGARKAVSLKVALVLAALTASAACGPLPGPRTFDSAEYVREEYASRTSLPPDDLAVPFELSEEIRQIVDKRLNPGAREQERVDQVIDFIFGGLDLRYERSPTRSAVETFSTRSGNCLSFVNLFVGVARRVHLNPFYVEVKDHQRWNVSHGSVVSHGHIVAGLRIDGDLATFDFLPYRAKSYRDFNPISDIKATAHYYNNLGAEALLDGEMERALRLTEIAVALAPDFDKALNNQGVALLRMGRADEALELYRRGLELDPESVALLTNIARAYQSLGRQEKADEYLARLEGLRSSNPFFYVYRGETALVDGDTETALRYMRKAYKRDSELPEVHVGLVKVYLALGQRERALHHVERALQLDATHREARKYAAMLLGPPDDESE